MIQATSTVAVLIAFAIVLWLLATKADTVDNSEEKQRARRRMVEEAFAVRGSKLAAYAEKIGVVIVEHPSGFHASAPQYIKAVPTFGATREEALHKFVEHNPYLFTN